jgi:hypothetical protein
MLELHLFVYADWGEYADPLDLSQVHDDHFCRLHGNIVSSLRQYGPEANPCAVNQQCYVFGGDGGVAEWSIAAVLKCEF